MSVSHLTYDELEDLLLETIILSNKNKSPLIRYTFGYNNAYYYATLFNVNIFKNYTIYRLGNVYCYFERYYY